ncbi:GH25 family lysozyme [Pediococcus argentinicus]|uniref:GH25 family lysozyme n=1 Tax=Pediococcus argentinicus TaxID=480391 RepID=UPI00338FF1D5
MKKIKIIVAALVLPFLFSLKAHADALPSESGDRVLDVSTYNGNINWKRVKQNKKMNTKFAIVRVQHGKHIIDQYQKKNADGLSANKIPFGTYAYSMFSSVADAKSQAKMFYKLSDKRTKFYVLDDEQHIKGNEQSYINAWLAQMRKLTNKKLVFYTYQSYIPSYHINYSGFDGLWMARYSSGNLGYNPDLWQFSPYIYKNKGLPNGVTADISYMRHLSTVMSWLKPYTKVTYAKVNAKASIKKNNYKIWAHVPNSQAKIKSVGMTNTYVKRAIKVVQKGTRVDNKADYYKISYKGKNIGWVNKSALKVITYQKVTYARPKEYQGYVKKTDKNLKLYNHVPGTSASAKVVAKGVNKKDLLFFDVSAVRADKTKWIRIKKADIKGKFWIPKKDVRYDPLRPVNESVKNSVSIKSSNKQK